MEHNEGKTMGLRARITAWITGVVVIMALFFFTFVIHQARAVYTGVLDSALFTWGGQMASDPDRVVLSCPVFSGGETDSSRLNMGFLSEDKGDPSGWRRFGLASGEGGEAALAYTGLLGEARRVGQPLFRTVDLNGGRVRIMALPPMGSVGSGSLTFAPVDASPPGTEGLWARFALAAGCLFVVVLAGGYLYAWYLVRPIEVLTSVSEKIAKGNLDEGVSFTGSPELVSLSQSINRMRRSIADKIRESELQNQELQDKREELEASNRELERSIFKANQMAAEAEIRSYELEHEVVQRRQAEEALRSSEEKYRAIVENMKEGYCEVNREGCVTFVNTAMSEITGYDSGEILGMHRGQLIAEEHRDKVIKAFTNLLEGEGDVAEFDYPIVRKDGQKRHIGVSVSLIRDGAGERTGYRTIVRDVAARKRYEEELIHMAYHDPLTGLKNRKGFYERLEGDITRAKRYGNKVALLYIDIDRFKQVNDTLGHEAGDMVLQEITRRLLSRFRKSDCLARIGGDEFAVVLDNDGGCDVDAVTRKVVDTLSQPYEVGNHIVDFISGSVGAALFPDDAVTAGDLIKFADSAMYEAKRERKRLEEQGTDEEEQA